MRLINADVLVEEHCNGCSPDIREMCKTDPVCASMMWVVAAPTVDAVEVVHGRWITEINHFDGLKVSYLRTCSLCKYTYTNRYVKGHNYCPNCGARMDLED